MRQGLFLIAILCLPGIAQAAPCHCARHRARVHAHRGAYHLPRFDQAEAEAEVHTQYRYRTPYLPYWVFP